MSGIRLLDVRGMRCPWPVLRLARVMRELPPGAQVRILADDPIAPAEIRALAEGQGWALAPGAGEDVADLIVTR